MPQESNTYLLMILDGKALASKIKGEVAEKVAACVAEGHRAPQLLVILLGEDPGSVSYVKGKARDAEEVGFKGTTLRLPAETTEEELLERIAECNADPEVDGLLVQLPLPRHIDEQKVIAAIDPAKDVDGFHPANVAGLYLRTPSLTPCTPKGIIRMLRESGTQIEGKKAVVIGRSNIVGLPVAKLLLDNNATVTIAHSRTPDLAAVASQADILVVAVGRPELVTADMVKPGAVVIDVGVNRHPQTGKLCGDVHFASCAEKASAITPVPGGVGPLTRACLMENTLECYLRNIGK